MGDPTENVLDLGALAALRPRALELAAAIAAGDLAACFDAAEIIDTARELAAPTHQLVRDAETSDTGSPSLGDCVMYLELYLSGVYDVEVALDDARASSAP